MHIGDAASIPSASRWTCFLIPCRHLRAYSSSLALLALAPWVQAETVIVTARTGAITTLDRQEAERLYLGRTATLADGTPVTLADLPRQRATGRFLPVPYRQEPLQIRTYWSRIVFTGRALPPKRPTRRSSFAAGWPRIPT